MVVDLENVSSVDAVAGGARVKYQQGLNCPSRMEKKTTCAIHSCLATSQHEKDSTV